MQCNFSKDSCVLSITTSKGTTTYKFGWENWLLNKDTALYAFPVPGRIHMPSKMAGTATWVNENTLQLNARFVEAMHGDKLTCTFGNNNITVSFLNSVSENAKNDIEKRLPLTGTM